jgi:hypothetical protein
MVDLILNINKLRTGKPDDKKERMNNMKKLFVSVPMKGRTEKEIKESIQKMKKIAEIYEGEELELIDSYIEDNPPQNKNQAVWYLGESLKKLAQADVFIGIREAYDWNGCLIEKETASKYRIKCYEVSAKYVIDGYDALLRKLHPVCCDEMPTKEESK